MNSVCTEYHFNYIFAKSEKLYICQGRKVIYFFYIFYINILYKTLKTAMSSPYIETGIKAYGGDYDCTTRNLFIMVCVLLLIYYTMSDRPATRTPSHHRPAVYVVRR